MISQLHGCRRFAMMSLVLLGLPCSHLVVNQLLQLLVFMVMMSVRYSCKHGKVYFLILGFFILCMHGLNYNLLSMVGLPRDSNISKTLTCEE